MSAEKKKQKNVLVLIVALVAVLFGSVLFMGAVGGWFSGVPMTTLDDEYYCDGFCNDGFMELTGEEYENLIKSRKSFLVLVDQDGCTTADRLREYVMDYAKGVGVMVYRIMFAEMKETSLHDSVKYYPSVVVVSQGKPIAWLRADSDEDAEEYNNYEAFVKWIQGLVVEKSTGKA